MNLVINGVVYCLKGMAVTIDKRKGKYSIIKRIEQDENKQKEITFKVSNDLLPIYFSKSISYPQV